MTNKKTAKIGEGKPGPGRPKNALNKTTRTIKEGIEAAFKTLQRDPKVKLTRWAKDNPTEFYKLASKLIPQQMRVEGKLTLEQLVAAAGAGEPKP